MSLDAVITDINSIPESMREHYSEVANVGFVLQTNDHVNDNVSYGLIDSHGFKTTLTTLRGEIKDLKSGAVNMDAYTALGTPAELTTKIADLTAAAGNAGKDNEAYKASIDAKYESDLATVIKAKDEALTQVLNANHSSSISGLIAANSGDLIDDAGVRGYLETQIKSMTKVNEVGQTIVVNPDGTPRLSAAVGSMEAMTLGELWGSNKVDPRFTFAIKASGASGTGSSGQSSGGAASGTGLPVDGASWNALTQEARMAFNKTNPSQAATFARAGAKL